ncbi:hypothetical protein ERJ75_001379700 [Trypanosoma vivax]|nr:hypothetical protein ERJ75_001379700 [Trypanosoma vivax]
MSLLTRRADAPQRTAAVRRGKADTHRAWHAHNRREARHNFHTACAEERRGSARGTVASGSAAVGSRPDTVMRGRGAGQREVARQPSTDVWARPRHATCRFASGARTPGRRRRGEHMDAAAVRQAPRGFPFARVPPWPPAACSTFPRAHEENVHHVLWRRPEPQGVDWAKEDACVLAGREGGMALGNSLMEHWTTPRRLTQGSHSGKQPKASTQRAAASPGKEGARCLKYFQEEGTTVWHGRQQARDDALG